MHRLRLSSNRPLVEPLESRTLFSGDMVVQWNQIMIGALRQARFTNGAGKVGGIGPTVAARDLAMMNMAIYDAVNGIDGSHQQYDMDRFGPRDASESAAAAEAAYKTLRFIFPAEGDVLRQDLQQSLEGLGDGRSVRLGMQWGETVAERMIDLRGNDGSNASVQYLAGTAPGQWQPDPLNPAQQAWGPGEGSVTPFMIKSSAQFRAPAPPALDSPAYAAALNQVESLGAQNSTTRTADQTQAGIFWAYDRVGMGSPLVLYDQAVITVSQQMHNTLDQDARLFALVGAANADSGFSAWDTKYFYNLWRPITAIRDAGSDNNPAATADSDWKPLGAPGDGVVPDFTPPFPTYVSGHATFGAATFEVLKQFYGTDNIHFVLTSDELPGVTRSFNSFSQAAAENGISRVYLGIHFNFDNTAGQAIGRNVADYVMDDALRPR